MVVTMWVFLSLFFWVFCVLFLRWELQKKILMGRVHEKKILPILYLHWNHLKGQDCIRIKSTRDISKWNLDLKILPLTITLNRLLKLLSFRSSEFPFLNVFFIYWIIASVITKWTEREKYFSIIFEVTYFGYLPLISMFLHSNKTLPLKISLQDKIFNQYFLHGFETYFFKAIRMTMKAWTYRVSLK